MSEMKDSILEKKEKEKARQKAKSGKPPSDGAYVEPIQNPVNSMSFSMKDISKEKWDKIFGKKKTIKKNSSKKTR